MTCQLTNLPPNLTLFPSYQAEYFLQILTLISVHLLFLLQEYRVLVVLMELVIQATREFPGSLDYQEIQVNRAAQDFQEFVMCPCVIGPTTSGNITTKDQMSDNIWERLLLITRPNVWRKSFTVSLLTPSETVWEILHWRQLWPHLIWKAF